jgi:HSP20 family protein
MLHFKVKPRSTNSIPADFSSVINELLKSQERENNTQKYFVPKANILEYEDKYEIQLELPGYSKQDVDIQVDKDLLIIQRNEKVKKEEKSICYHLNQIKSGSFKRVFEIPENTSEDSIKAKFENGILIVQLPKVESKPLKKSVVIG